MGDWADSLVEGQIMTATGCGRREAMGYLRSPQPKESKPIPTFCKCGKFLPSKGAARRCRQSH